MKTTCCLFYDPSTCFFWDKVSYWINLLVNQPIENKEFTDALNQIPCSVFHIQHSYSMGNKKNAPSLKNVRNYGNF
jgi:hypothetical protein